VGHFWEHVDMNAWVMTAKRMGAKIPALPTSHVPMLSKPKEVAAFIAAAANGVR
jgi:hypothetical protein